MKKINEGSDFSDTTFVETSPEAFPYLLYNGGQMGERIRNHDWTHSELGALETWPTSLRMVINIVLASRFPMILFWGSKLHVLYNDGYIPIFGSRHPEVLGKTGFDAWGEAWNVLEPMFDTVMNRGEATWSEDQLLILTRNGYTEECYFTWSYIPVRNDQGKVAGVLTPITETTMRVIGERRLKNLRELSSTAIKADTVSEACHLCGEALVSNAADIPFLGIYMLDKAEQTLTLSVQRGLEKTQTLLPTPCPLETMTGEPEIFLFFRKTLKKPLVELEDPERYIGKLTPTGIWPESPRTAVILSIASGEGDTPAGLMLVGINARRDFDDNYRGFLELAASQISNAIATALSYEKERERIEALAKIDRAKTTFFTNISHEFRTPLTLMLSPLEDSLSDTETPLPPKQLQRQTLIYKNAQRLLKLVNSLLDFSRLEANRASAFYEPTHLEKFTTDLASMFRSVVEKAGLKFNVDTPPLSTVVYVDRQMWEKIVLNLLSNAFKFTLKGEINVFLKETSTHAVLTIQDTGIGIESDEIPHLFERFHRVEQAKGRSYEGSGIGLALVQELVKLHQGSIEVTSQLQGGTTFTLSIPLGHAHLPTPAIKEGTDSSSTSLKHNPFISEALSWLPVERVEESPTEELCSELVESTEKRARILLVDDNTDMRTYIQGVLEQDWDITIAENGKVALEAAQMQLPDLIISDVMMPEMDGFELIRQLRLQDSTKQLPVILLSARSGEEAKVEGLKKGAVDYLVKPFSAKELKTRVQLHVELSQLRLQLEKKVMERTQALATSEARYRTLTLVAPVGIIQSDVEGKSQYTNPYVLELFQLTLEEFQEKKWLHRLHPDDKERVLTEWESFLHYKQPSSVLHLTFRLYLDEKTTKWIYCQTLSQTNPESGIVGYISACTDVTAQKNLEKERLHALEQVAEQQRLRSQELEKYRKKQDKFIDNICHELRNPANGISGSVSILREKINARSQKSTSLTAQQHKVMDTLLDNIQDCVQYQMAMIDDVVILTKLETNTFVLENTIFDPKKTILLVIEMFKPYCSTQEIQLHYYFPVTLDLIKGDDFALKQVLMHLIGKAIKDVYRGELTLFLKDKEDSFLEITLKYTGIQTEENEKIKVPLNYKNHPMYYPYGHSGLGVSISKKLVSLMGGQLELHMNGSINRTLQFTFHTEQVTQTQSPKSSLKNSQLSMELSPKKLTYAKNSKKILIVDDNALNQKVLNFVLKKEGYQCVIANDGFEAVTFCKADRFDLIFMDIQMPVMDGFEATEQIRQEEASLHLPPVPIICLSGNVRESYKEQALKSGMNDFMGKPFEKTAVLKKVEEFLSTHNFSPVSKLSRANRSKSFEKNISELRQRFDYSVKSDERSTFFVPSFHRQTYAKWLIKSFIPTGVLIEKAVLQQAIKLLYDAFVEKHITHYLLPETEKLIKRLFRHALYQTWGSFFYCGSWHAIRMLPGNNHVSFNLNALKHILAASAPSQLFMTPKDTITASHISHL